MVTHVYTQALQAQSDKLRLILSEIALENVTSFQKAQRPEVRLVIVMTSTLLAVSTQNNLRAVTRGHQAANITPPVTSAHLCQILRAASTTTCKKSNLPVITG
jgi:hypothetical protein